MRGAVAAGNRHTADAGAWALAEGGNTVDAIVAAALAGFVAEGPLTGPSGGGFLLLRNRGHDPVLLDCFFAVPSAPPGTMDEVVIDFGDASTQMFHVGDASVAVPGLVAGLEAAHTAYGRVPWRRLFEPALELARRGVEMSSPQRFLLEILVPILERTEEGRAIYGSRTRAETATMQPGLELLRAQGREAVASLVPGRADDIARYRVVERTPLETSFRGARVVTTPHPSIGGDVVAAGLAYLDTADIAPSTIAVTLAHALRIGYDGATGELLTTTYNDTAEAIPTPGVTYTYNRAGQMATIADGAGLRTFAYQAAAPWRADYEDLPAFFGSRRLTRLYENATSTTGSFSTATDGPNTLPRPSSPTR